MRQESISVSVYGVSMCTIHNNIIWSCTNLFVIFSKSLVYINTTKKYSLKASSNTSGKQKTCSKLLFKGLPNELYVLNKITEKNRNAQCVSGQVVIYSRLIDCVNVALQSKNIEEIKKKQELCTNSKLCT